MLLDTNIIIYSNLPDGAWLSAWTNHPDAAIASVTRIEVLGFSGITHADESSLRLYLSHSLTYPLDEEVIERAITLRQAKKMKIGDAIIAATALEYDLPLVTRNEGDFKHIADLKIINPFSD